MIMGLVALAALAAPGSAEQRAVHPLFFSEPKAEQLLAVASLEAPPLPPTPPPPPKSVNRLLASITIDEPGVAKTVVVVREGGQEGDTMIMFLGRRNKVGQEPGWPHFVDAADCPAALAMYQNKDQVAADSAKYLTDLSPASAAVKGPTYLVEFEGGGSGPKRIGPHGSDSPAGQWIKKMVQILEKCWIPAIVSMEKG